MYRSVISNTSKEMSCFSDFPFPEDFPSFLPHNLFLEYFRMYAQHFQLLRHIRFKVGWDRKQEGFRGCRSCHHVGGWDNVGSKAHKLCTLWAFSMQPFWLCLLSEAEHRLPCAPHPMPRAGGRCWFILAVQM